MKFAKLLILVFFVGVSSGYGQNTPAPVKQGGVLRWTDNCVRCAMGNHRWRAVDGTCYFPIDLIEKTGYHRVYRWTKTGRRKTRTILVAKGEFKNEDFKDFEKKEYVNVSAANQRRQRREQAQIWPLFTRPETKPLFTLPLGKPANPLPATEGNFGAYRTFDGSPRNRHTGTDYPIGTGQPVLSMADGKVVLTANHFFGGNSVFVDHGNGLVTMYLHLSGFAVKKGDRVKKGQKIGEVGETGRATGPHLHLGVRWHNARIDPAVLLEDPAKLPALD
ncbi:M23 family metallopeptidase [Larkinella terrae]|uniref:Peptidoglycan DD-metalloendopeptidase family protein n=1 Tax=Larkinella terrae TaxID=2025311 RepID=A0A7K0EP32_9BACT|nr:M23 family metallopeptidase [Larkinella terrae]MRS63603.1 peptidoglycan DD-metalloendopeptidase family protein [Larkinella terrae]